MMPSATVHIAVCSDAAYLVPTVVMLTSAKLNKAPDSHYCIHFMLTEPCRMLADLLQQLNSPDFEVQLHQIDLSHMEGLRLNPDAPNQSYISLTTFVRLRLCELLPELSKVLYIDCDALVLKDLQQIYSQDLGDYLFAATPEPGPLTQGFQEKVGQDGQYVNAGILLMNLELMRKENWSATILEVARNMPQHWTLMDQDAINSSCQGRILHMPLRYNYMGGLYHLRCTLKDINDMGNRYQNWDEADLDAVILHFGGPQKPWLYVDAPASNLWSHYLHLSPYANLVQTKSVFVSARRPTTKFRLFGILPLLTYRPVSSDKGLYKALLFDVLPLWTVHNKETKRGTIRSVKLFGILPLFDIKTR